MLCENELACNYGEDGECNYVDTDIDVAGPFMLGLVDTVLCVRTATKSPTMASSPWSPAPADMDAGYEWFITPEVADLMLASGFEILYNDLTSQSVYVCGTDLTAGEWILRRHHSSTYDGTGWYWPLYDGYIAPASNFETGCNDPEYCNFDPCALPDSTLCTVLELLARIQHNRRNRYHRSGGRHSTVHHHYSGRKPARHGLPGCGIR